MKKPKVYALTEITINDSQFIETGMPPIVLDIPEVAALYMRAVLCYNTDISFKFKEADINYYAARMTAEGKEYSLYADIISEPVLEQTNVQVLASVFAPHEWITVLDEYEVQLTDEEDIEAALREHIIRELPFEFFIIPVSK